MLKKDELTDDDKNRIVKDSIENFNEHANPGWLTHRKSVSADAAFVEWEDSQETFRVTHGKEFIDGLGGLCPNWNIGIIPCGISRQCRQKKHRDCIKLQKFRYI
jgi:hypothetical protein